MGTTVDVIRKTHADCRVRPNFEDYEHARATFDWSDVPALCEGMRNDGCNIAYAAVDRHADGPAASRTALRFIADTGSAGELVTHDISYAELARLTRRFTNVLRSLAVAKGERVFAIM